MVSAGQVPFAQVDWFVCEQAPPVQVQAAAAPQVEEG